MLNFQNLGADFKRELMGDVQDIVARAISSVTTTFAAQQNGTVMSDQHRILNFSGPGVAVTDDPANRRTNIVIPGAPTGGTATTATTLSVAGTGKGFVLGSEPAGWQAIGFDDSGWTTVAAETGETFGATIPSAAWITVANASQAVGLVQLHRRAFTISANPIATATLTVHADNFIDQAWINNVSLGTSFPNWDIAHGSPAVVSLPLVSLVTGTNVLALKARNGPTGGPTSYAYRIDITQTVGGTFILSQLGADVSFTGTTTYVDGPSVSLPVGTWLLVSNVTATDTAGSGTMEAKLWDGASNILSSGEMTTVGANQPLVFSLAGAVAVAATTTFKVSVVNSTRVAGAIKAATPQNSSGNNASTLIAVRIG